MHKKIIALLVGLSLILPLTAYAAEFRTGEQATLGSSESVAGNLYLAGGSVSSSGSVKGDLAAAGGTVTVTGPVANDLLAAGGNITEVSDIGGDARIAGGNIHLQGKVGGDVVIGGGQITLEGAGVSGDATIAGGSVTIDAPIAGNVHVYADSLTLGPNTAINGDLTYTASKQATMDSGATVRGKIDFTRHPIPSTNDKTPQAVLAAFFTFWLFARLAMLLVGTFALFLIFPRYARQFAANYAEKPLLNLGRGFLAFVALPVGGVLLLVTVIGVPLGVFALLTFAGFIIFATLAAPIAIGSVVHKWIWKPETYHVTWKTVLLGIAVYFVLGLIPFIGGLAKMILVLVAAGVILQIKWSATKDWR